MAVSRGLESSWAVLVEEEMAASWAVEVASELAAPYGIQVEAELSAPWGRWVERAISASYIAPIQRGLSASWAPTIEQDLMAPYAMLAPVVGGVLAPWSGSVNVAADCAAGWAILSHTPVSAGLRAIWSLPASVAIDGRVDVSVTHQGHSLPVFALDIATAEGEYAWSGSLTPADPSAFQGLLVGGMLTVALGEEIWSLMVDNKTLSRDGASAPRLSVSIISPTARFAAPLATPIDREWNAPTQARQAAEESVGEPIAWTLLEWLIPAGRLAVHQATPLETARTIARAAGGVVETTPGGALRARHRFPIPVPLWDSAEPDVILTDAEDNLSCQESHRARSRVNRVVVRGYTPATGHLSAQVDGRSEGLNRGRTSFHSGGAAHLLVHHGPETTLPEVRASAGAVHPGADQEYEATQDLVFDGGFDATLSLPALTIQSTVWLGEDLGALTLESDGRTVTAERSGVAIARVSALVRARSWSVTSPTVAGGLDSFPVRVRAMAEAADQAGEGEIVCQRGDGEFPGEDISDSLLFAIPEKLSRGRAEIDAGEALQEVSLTCRFRAGLMPGHLVEVHDALMGRSWRGKVVEVAHSATGARCITSLRILRHVPN